MHRAAAVESCRNMPGRVPGLAGLRMFADAFAGWAEEAEAAQLGMLTERLRGNPRILVDRTARDIADAVLFDPATEVLTVGGRQYPADDVECRCDRGALTLSTGRSSFTIEQILN